MADTRHYYYSDQWQVLEERLNAGTSADRWYVWGLRYIDDLILRDDGTDRLYALHDYFSVTAVVDTSGNVQERYGYDGFGAPRYMTPSFGSRGSSNYNWETLYAAYRYDLESGLYQVRNRYLHPNLGRLVTPDPLGEVGFELVRNGVINPFGGGPNLYAYVNNNVINNVDPLGLETYFECTQRCGTQNLINLAACVALGIGLAAVALIICEIFPVPGCAFVAGRWIFRIVAGCIAAAELAYLNCLSGCGLGLCPPRTTPPIPPGTEPPIAV